MWLTFCSLSSSGGFGATMTGLPEASINYVQKMLMSYHSAFARHTVVLLAVARLPRVYKW
jgi:hypothetical protein